MELDQGTSLLASVSNALVALHKEQFGRGPTRARTDFANADTMICVMEDALLPAERAMVAMGESHRVQESRVFFQSASSRQFIDAVELIVNRKVKSFASATDPEREIVTEIYIFWPEGQKPGAPETDGHRMERSA